MLLARNRKALRNYEVTEKFLAGIKLKGYEVKALREKKVSFEGAYVKVMGGEVWLMNMHIGRYSKQSQKVPDGEADRPRKLLLSKREIDVLRKEVAQKGKTAVPLALLLKHNLVKLELGIVRGRKAHEKKHLEKERQIRRDLEKERKERI